MAIQLLIGIDVGESILVNSLRADDQLGLPFAVFVKNLSKTLSIVCKQNGLPNCFEFKSRENGSLQELQHLQSSGYIVLLNHRKPDNHPHWAVLSTLDEHAIHLLDPDFGPNHRYPLDEFIWCGGSETTPTYKAYIAIRYTQ